MHSFVKPDLQKLMLKNLSMEKTVKCNISSLALEILHFIGFETVSYYQSFDFWKVYHSSEKPVFL